MSPQRKPPSNSRPVAVLLVLAGGALLVIAALFIGLAGQPKAQPTPTFSSGAVDEIARVSLADAKAAYDSARAVFVDVRDTNSYNQRHITKALNIPLGDIAARIGELNPKDWIITY